MTLLQQLQNTQGVEVHDVYSENNFEITTNDETSYYFIHIKDNGSVTLQPPRCASDMEFSNATSALNYIKATI